ncbi:hypothetical protein BI292_03765 [Pseudomonas sp. 43NM1]|nr:hypothetical protein BI292_03765 [Pseudomonas sp. 43NM1]
MGAFKVVFSRPGAIRMKSRITPEGWVRKLLNKMLIFALNLWRGGLPPLDREAVPNNLRLLRSRTGASPLATVARAHR